VINRKVRAFFNRDLIHGKLLNCFFEDQNFLSANNKAD